MIVGPGVTSVRPELHDVRAHDRTVLAGQYQRFRGAAPG